MAAAACGGTDAGEGPDDFEPWLSDKLRALRTDENVFGSYIAGILDGEDSLDDKKEALEGILSEFVEQDIGKHVSEILDKWTLSRRHPPTSTAPASDVDLQLTRLLEAQSLTTVAPRCYTDEEKKIRDVILSQYSQLSDHEEGADAAGAQPEREGPELERNTNAETVAAAARERRDQARLDSQRKKEKDKEDREKQKQQKEEKKEKRKTQKGERKR